MKRVISMVLCLMLVMSLATTAFAADITFTGGATGATYSAYKLLNSTDGGSGKFAYTLNEKYTAILQAVTGKTEQEDIVGYISALGSAGIGGFAEAVYNAIDAADLDADYITTNDSITNAEQGYYLIAETVLGTRPDGATDTYSLIMVDTLGQEDVTITTKENVPTIDKEVKELNDSTGTSHWGENADYDVGDTIEFRLSATVSGKYEEYKRYDYAIIDEMDEGLTYKGDIKIMVGDVDITEYFVIDDSDRGFKASANLKAVDAADNDVVINGHTVIKVTYTATLNENAKKGVEGNKNKSRIEYQNNPYTEEEGTPGKTPDDTTIVFTFDGIVNKVDNQGNALAGAGFTLYKYVESSNSWVKVGEEITGVTTFKFEGLDAGEYKLVESTVPDGYNKADDIEFTIEGIYDTSKDPVELTGLVVKNALGDIISSAVVMEDAGRATPTFVTDKGEGYVSTDVVNQSGSELPETGGVGTTMFYVFGSIMMIGAAILLVAKKRMAE